MASVTSVTKTGAEGTITADYQGQAVTETFNIFMSGDGDHDFPGLIVKAAAASALFPDLGDPWPTNAGFGLFAKSFAFKVKEEKNLQSVWECTVNYLPLQPGEPSTENTSTNPLGWPATYWLEWVEYEQAITKARNVEAFTGGFTRAAGTLGPVVNTAFQEFEEGLFDTVRDAVLVVKKNVATLSDVIARNRDFQLTTNSDTVLGADPRRMKFLGADSGGKLTANGVNYYEMTTRIQVTKTTDREVNNVGWKELVDGQKLVNIKVPKPGATPDNQGKYADSDMEDTPEPLFLDLAGKKKTSGTQTITYRYLEEVPYTPLLS